MLDISQLHPLPSFTLDSAPLSSAQAEYCQYYGLDFLHKGLCKHHHFGRLDLASFHIAVQYFRCEKPKGTVVINHGYLDHSGLYRHPITALLTANFNVLIYDLPGHGLSSGARVSIDSFADYQRVLTALLAELDLAMPRPLHLLGQSTGGAITMDYLLNNPRHGFNSAVLLAPLVQPTGWPFIRAQLALVSPWLRQVPRRFKDNSNDAKFRYFLAQKDPLQSQWISLKWLKALRAWIPNFVRSDRSSLPVLVIQGDADTTVRWRVNLPIIESLFRRSRPVILHGAMHQLANEAVRYRLRINDEITNFLRRSSGS
ncbi:Phospholipase YtpA [BD1-7 clade bacterium]|uniref:Phospholipase YtpA n=1 Tax=BD1-7 clade bacterium TaxID=2029982 RepID=A0A5S9N3H5_9GAMM|nr:Phospholipase YtpA [BD1-7 clade bacterium]CAA0084313.1 Phospholipase YtpA [BD1-7 clade bacterium]